VKYFLAIWLTALQAAIMAVTGWLLVLVPMVLIWFIESDGRLELMIALRVAVYSWLLAHGVPVQVAAGELSQIEFDAFQLTGLPLGYSILIFLLLVAFGHRLSALPILWPSWLVGAITYSAFGFGANLLALNPAVSVADWQALLFPGFWFLLLVSATSLLGSRFELIRGSGGKEAPERRALSAGLGLKKSLHWSISSVAAPAIRGGLVALLLIFFILSLWLSIQLALNWLEVIRLYEALQLTALGVLVVTLAQLFLLPNLIAWGIAWLSGVGFAIGAGSNLSPLGNQVGPLPALPIFAALPDASSSSILFVLVPVASGFLATLLIRKHSADMRWEYATRLSAATALALGIATVFAIGAWLVVTLASGSFGPGRLEAVGANAALVALVSWLQVFLGSIFAGLLVLNPISGQRGRRG
jgi:hypothetical protein